MPVNMLGPLFFILRPKRTSASTKKALDTFISLTKSADKADYNDLFRMLSGYQDLPLKKLANLRQCHSEILLISRACQCDCMEVFQALANKRHRKAFIRHHIR